MSDFAVILYGVTRNLNRAYRTCEAFGVKRLVLLRCGEVTGNLYRAAGRIDIVRLEGLPKLHRTVALECHCGRRLSEVNWSAADSLLIGGETVGLPAKLRKAADQLAHIPMVGEISGLTVEAALAIALYDRSVRVCHW